MQGIASRIFSSGENNYHPLYDLDANGELNIVDLSWAVRTLGAEVPLLDQQIAQVTQATMKYYGPNGVQNALADGYIPLKQPSPAQDSASSTMMPTVREYQLTSSMTTF